MWLGILLLASVNGAVRATWLIPRTGETAGRAISTIILCGLVFLVTWLTIGWIKPSSTGEALKVGILWLGLTLAFEFLVGHYVLGNPWSALLEDYDLSRGRIWIAVLIVTFFAPLWAGRVRGMLH